MTVPANIISEQAALQAQIAAANPLSRASSATVKALQLNAENLVSDIQAALTATGIIDTWSAPVDPQVIVAGINSLVEAAGDQASLSLMRGVTGRVLANLDQLA